MRNSRNLEAIRHAIQDYQTIPVRTVKKIAFHSLGASVAATAHRLGKASAAKPGFAVPRVEGMSATASSVFAVFLVAVYLLLPATAALALDPLLSDGLEEHKYKNYKKAIELYTRALDKNIRLPEAYNWRGMAYDELGELDKAIPDYDEAIRLEPKYADAYNNRGEAYRKKGNTRKAMADYKKAAELDEKFPEPHYNLAIILESQGNMAAAAAEYKKFADLAPAGPDKVEVLNKLQTFGKAMAAEGKPEAAPGVKPPPGAAPKPRVAQERPGVTPPGRPGVTPPGRPGVQPPGRPRAFKPGFPKPEAPGKGFGFEKKGPQIPGLPPEVAQQIPPEVLQLMVFMQEYGPILNIASLVSLVLFCLFTFLIARKLALPLAWLGFIPIVNYYTLVRCAGKPWWWLILLILLSFLFLIPGVIVWLLICIGIARERGKSVLWGILMFIPCTQPIGMGYLALSR